MKKLLLLAFIFLLGLRATGQFRQGYFYYDKVIIEFPEYSLSQKKLDSLKFKMQDSINILSEQYEKYMLSLLVDRQMDSLIKKQINYTITILVKKITDYNDFTYDLLKKVEKIIQENIKNQFIKEIKNFSIVNSIDCIVEKPALLYCDKCVDMTDELIKYLRQKQ